MIELFPTGEHADDTVRRTVDALIKGRGYHRDEVAEAAGISRSAFYRKMSGRGDKNTFSAGEVASLAAVLGVSVAQLFDGLGGTFVPPPNGGDGLRARRDSNSQPSDPKVGGSPHHARDAA